jgi:hypothetical protein
MLPEYRALLEDEPCPVPDEMLGELYRASAHGLLYEAAQSMLRSKKWSWLKAWAMQIARRRGMKKAIVALARRLAVIMHRIWVDGTEFRWTREAAAG